MATGNFVLDKGYDAAVAMSKYRAVKFSAEETVTVITAATDVPAGINQFAVTADDLLRGKGASVRVMGASEMEVSAAITPGQLVAMSSDGRAKPAVATERVIGRCDEGATTAGHRARVQLMLPGFILA